MDQIEGKESLSSPKTEDAKEVRGVLAKPLERDGCQETICLEKASFFGYPINATLTKTCY